MFGMKNTQYVYELKEKTSTQKPFEYMSLKGEQKYTENNTLSLQIFYSIRNNLYFKFSFF